MTLSINTSSDILYYICHAEYIIITYQYVSLSHYYIHVYIYMYILFITIRVLSHHFNLQNKSCMNNNYTNNYLKPHGNLYIQTNKQINRKNNVNKQEKVWWFASITTCLISPPNYTVYGPRLIASLIPPPPNYTVYGPRLIASLILCYNDLLNHKHSINSVLISNYFIYTYNFSF